MKTVRHGLVGCRPGKAGRVAWPGAHGVMTRLGCIVLTLLGLTVWSGASAWQPIAQPELPEGTIELSVAHVNNERFPNWSTAQLEAALDMAARMAVAHLGLDVTFKNPERIPIRALFEAIPKRALAWRDSVRYGGPRDRASVQDVYRALIGTLRDQQAQLESMRAFVMPFVPSVRDAASLRPFAEEILKAEILGHERWRRWHWRDNEPLQDQSNTYHDWTTWAMVGYGRHRFDVVITNQPVVSVSRAGSSLHSAIRGGFTFGSTFYHPDARFDGFVMVSTLPLDTSFVGIRGDGLYDEPLRVRALAALIVHELGHLLLRLGHPYGMTSCVMRPVPYFGFRDWVAGLDASACRTGTSRAMTPGASALYGNLAW